MTRYTISPALLVWVVLGASIHMLGGFGAHDKTMQLLLGSLGLAHSVIGFWTDGGRRLTAPSIYFFAAGLFIYFPGLYLTYNDPILHGSVSLVPALTVCYFAQLAMYYLFWKPREAEVAWEQSAVDPTVTTWGIWMGLVLLVAGVGLRMVGGDDVALVNGMAFSGIILLAVSSLRRARRVTLWAYLVIGGAFFAYMTFVFTGFGRLELGSLGLGIAMAAAHRWRRRGVKLFLLAGIGPALSYLAQSRVAFTATLNPNQSQTVNGLESVLSPMVRFAQLLELDATGQVVYTWGSSFFASLVVLVPRQVWPDKPLGFGAELAHLFRPDLDGSGHSELALLHGELVVGFGWDGLVLLVLALGFLVRWIDRAMVKSQSIPLDSRRNLLKIVAITLVGASIVDLLWGGTFTYMARVAPRLLIIFVLFVLFAWAVKRAPKPRVSPAYRDMIKKRQAERAKV